MKILFLVSVAILATFVQADMPTADEVSLAKQVRICLDMGNDKSTCLEKFADKIAKFDPVHFNAVVNYEAVLKELNEFLAIYNVEGGHKIRQTLEIMKQKAQASRQKRDMPTADEISLAKQVRICLDMGNDKASCMEKVADKIAKFDPVHFNAVVNYEAVLKELNEFFEFYKQGHNIRESLALLEQKHAAAAGQRQKREAPQAVQTLMLFYYLTGQCVEKNPTMNRVTCAIAMFGPNTENLKEKIDAYLKDKKELLAGFYESSKSKLGDVKDSVQGWFTETFGRNKRDLTSVVGDVTGAAKAQWEKIKACAEQGSNVFSCAYQLYGPKAIEVLSGLKDEISGWVKEAKEKFGRKERDVSSVVGDVKAQWEKIKACAEQGSNVFSCAYQLYGSKAGEVLSGLKDEIQGWIKELKEKFGRKERDVSSVVGDVKAQWEKIKACAEQGSNVFSCAYQLYGSKAGEVLSGLKDEIQGWIKELKEKLGRTKRDMPTQEQIGWAKAIKICLDMGKDKDSCYDKVLGANKANVDLVFLDTIGKYEDVLKELRQFLDIYNQGGHTIRETLLLLHKQQTAGKNRAITAANVQDLIDLKTVVLECLNALPNKDVTKCAVAVFGTQIQGSSQLQLVQQLINHPQVQEFARGAGQKLHSYMQSLDGFLGQLHGWAHSAYDWVVSLG